MLLEVGGFPSSVTVQYQVRNITSGSLEQAFTAVGVSESPGAGGLSDYTVSYPIVADNEYLIQWQASSGGSTYVASESWGLDRTGGIGGIALYGSVVAGSNTSSIFSVAMDLTQSVDFSPNLWFMFSSGANAGQVRKLSSFTPIVGGTPAAVAVQTAFTNVPSVNDRYKIIR